MSAIPSETELRSLVDQALASGDDGGIRAALVGSSARLDLRPVSDFAHVVGQVIQRPDPPVEALEALLDGWAALSESQAPGERHEVILPCAAVAAYGEAGAVRPEWFGDEIGKLRAAAGDPRWRVREAVARALVRLLDADWDRTMSELLDWGEDDNPLVARVATAAAAHAARSNR